MTDHDLTKNQRAVLRELERSALPSTDREVAEAMGWPTYVVWSVLSDLVDKSRAVLVRSEDDQVTYRAVRAGEAQAPVPARPAVASEQVVRKVLSDMLDAEAEHHVPRWHPDDQQVYRESLLGREETLELVRKERLDRALASLAEAGVVFA